MLEFIKQPWPWYVAGPLISLVMFSLIFFGKNFGISSSFRHVCAAMGAGKKIKFFNYNWKEQQWNLLFVVGTVLGGAIAHLYLQNPEDVVQIAETTKQDLLELGFTNLKGLVPDELFGTSNFLQPLNLVFIILGGFFVGCCYRLFYWWFVHDTRSVPNYLFVMVKGLKYVLAGIFFGIVLTKSEVISWFRIQEMFRFQSFHMYGIIGSAVLIGVVGILLIKKYHGHDLKGNEIVFLDKDRNFKAALLGGAIFGLGWAMTGACPGPLYILLGNGYVSVLLAIISAIAGTYVYGKLRDKLPH